MAAAILIDPIEADERTRAGVEPGRWAHTAALAADWLTLLGAPSDGDPAAGEGDGTDLRDLASGLRAELDGAEAVLAGDPTIRRLELAASALRIGFGAIGRRAIGRIAPDRRREAARALDDVADVLRARAVRRWSAAAL